MRGFMFPLCVLGTFAAGCDADCDNPSRLDGTYAVWSQASGPNVTVTGLENDPGARQEVLYAAFPNGWSHWNLTYVPNNERFQLVILGHDEVPDQTFPVAYQQSDDNCNSLKLSFDGTYSSGEATHLFAWTGDISYLGDSMTGTFTYSDTWTTDDNHSGSLNIPEGEVRASLGEDTGF